jgi:hypothetical protein
MPARPCVAHAEVFNGDGFVSLKSPICLSSTLRSRIAARRVCPRTREQPSLLSVPGRNRRVPGGTPLHIACGSAPCLERSSAILQKAVGAATFVRLINAAVSGWILDLADAITLARDKKADAAAYRNNSVCVSRIFHSRLIFAVGYHGEQRVRVQLRPCPEPEPKRYKLKFSSQVVSPASVFAIAKSCALCPPR